MELRTLRQQTTSVNLELLEKYEILSKSYIDLTIDYSKAKDELLELRKEVRSHSSVTELYGRDRTEWSNERIQLTNEIETLKEELQKVRTGSNPKNPFGAGRKRAYTDRIDEIKKLHDEGMSGRKIAEALGVPSATVTRYLKNERE